MSRGQISDWIQRLSTRFHAENRLVTWHPRGILDDALVDEIAYFTQTLEYLSEAPFDRFIDLSGLSEIRLQIGHVFNIAKERRSDTEEMPPVRSAFYCDKFVGSDRPHVQSVDGRLHHRRAGVPGSRLRRGIP